MYSVTFLENIQIRFLTGKKLQHSLDQNTSNRLTYKSEHTHRINLHAKIKLLNPKWMTFLSKINPLNVC